MAHQASAGRRQPAPLAPTTPPARRVVLAGQGGWLMMSTCCPITRSAAGQCCSRALGLGLAGELLAELAVTGAIRVAGDGCLVTARIRLADGLARAVQLRMLGERDRHSTGDRLAYLAQSAEANVAGRLAGAGYPVRASPGGACAVPRGGFRLIRTARSPR